MAYGLSPEDAIKVAAENPPPIGQQWYPYVPLPMDLPATWNALWLDQGANEGGRINPGPAYVWWCGKDIPEIQGYTWRPGLLGVIPGGGPP